MRRFRFDLPRGETIISVVQGNGGLCQAWYQLQREKERAARGEPLTTYEPKPGHVRLYPHYNAEGNGPHVDVPIEYLVSEESVHVADLKPGDSFRVSSSRLHANGEIKRVLRTNVEYETRYNPGGLAVDQVYVLKLRKEQLVGAEVVRGDRALRVIT
jgi:hypothetical protein